MALAPLYDIASHPLLGGKYTALKTPEEKEATQIMAELLLDLRAPAYTCDDALELAYAVVRQVNFQLEHGLTPDVVKSVSQTVPGTTTTYRERYKDPGAAAIVARVTKVATVGFTPMASGT
jgi:hypothetical protein